MPTWLNVAEKPSVAKEVATVLSGGASRSVSSQSRFNPVFEFSFEGNTMLVTSVAGHLMEDEFPPNTKSWSNFPFQGLFTAKITKTVKTELEPVKRNLEILSKRSQTLVLWLDCDREGENICFEVIQVALAQNPRLAVHRAHFSALTQRDLLHAVHHLKPPDRNLSDAVEARQELDLRIGAVFTRFQTIKFRDAFQGIPGVLSFGPCQFPTLGFVVQRHWERQGFVSEDYFTLCLQHETTKFHSSRGPMYDQLAATLVYDGMLEAAAAADHACHVKSVNQRPTHRRPPVPLATVVMQKLASRHLRMSSERCMALAESLYQEGYISYPRTETDSFAFTDAELLDFVRNLTGTPDVGDYADAMLAAPSERFRRPLRGGHDDKAHPPIHPTKAMAARTDERGTLYLLIVRHFLASISPDAVAATTSVAVEFGRETFTLTGTTIVEQGWLDIFPYERWNSNCIPNYAVGDAFLPTEVCLTKGRTTPPPNLTETDLIALMDENGIGTDATIAQHIKTVLSREYVKREGQMLIPTTLGIALASAYEMLGLSSLLHPQLRAQMELAMGDIANGQATKEQVVQAALRLYREIFDRVASNVSIFRNALATYLQPTQTDIITDPMTVVTSSFVPCGVCESNMDLMEGRDGERSTWVVRCHPCNQQYRLPNGRANRLQPTSPSQKCVICGFVALQVTNVEKQTTYTICPRCFTNPPPGGDIESMGDFRCFQCVADCPLAKGLESISIARCVSCQENHLRLRNSATGYYLACKGYPQCTMTVTLPTATTVKPALPRRCSTCDAVLLTFDFRGVQGVPGLDMVETTCVSCDVRMKEYISVKGYHPRDSTGLPGAVARQSDYSLPLVGAAPKRGSRSACASTKGGGTLCGCCLPAKQLTSRKEASRGKEFLTCANRKCSFFQWLDGEP